MFGSRDATKTDKLQGRVSMVVWGVLLIGLGTLLTLERTGKVQVPPPPHPAANAVDGNLDTRWSSEFHDPEWITVDLGQTREITRVSLHWEAAYSSAYEIQVSDDDASWKTVVSVTKGDGGVDDHSVAASGRYVRIFSTRRGTEFGHSLWELEVYGAGGLLSQGQPVTASSLEPSVESQFPWLRFWPLFLIASGLPMLLVPRDSGTQVIGLGLTAAGTFLELQKLGLTSWGFKEVLPVVFIAMGALLLMRSVWSQSKASE
jgi:F5/8 type C domain